MESLRPTLRFVPNFWFPGNILSVCSSSLRENNNIVMINKYMYMFVRFIIWIYLIVFIQAKYKMLIVIGIEEEEGDLFE